MSMGCLRAVIEGVGHAVPDQVLTNDDLSKMVDTNDEWIMKRVGIRERRITSRHECTNELAIKASNDAIQCAGIDPSELALVICGTVTPDRIIPSSACVIQDAVGAKHAGAFDLGAACAGFIYSLGIGASLIESGQHRNILVVGVDTLSRYLNWEDRSTCVLFGDAAGAVVIQARSNTDRGILKSIMLSDGSGAKYLKIEGGGAMHRPHFEDSCNYSPTIQMEGNIVYRFAVKAIGDACCKVLEMAEMKADEIDLFVPHQANIRIIYSAIERMGLDPKKVFLNLQRYGNTSGGSIPLALSEAVKEGRLKQGMNVLTVGCGAGLVWGANIIRW